MTKTSLAILGLMFSVSSGIAQNSWVVLIESDQQDVVPIVSGIAVDDDDNAYIVGRTGFGVIVNGTPIAVQFAPGTDSASYAFLAKCAPNGTPIWVRGFPTNQLPDVSVSGNHVLFLYDRILDAVKGEPQETELTLALVDLEGNLLSQSEDLLHEVVEEHLDEFNFGLPEFNWQSQVFDCEIHSLSNNLALVLYHCAFPTVSGPPYSYFGALVVDSQGNVNSYGQPEFYYYPEMGMCKSVTGPEYVLAPQAFFTSYNVDHQSMWSWMGIEPVPGGTGFRSGLKNNQLFVYFSGHLRKVDGLSGTTEWTLSGMPGAGFRPIALNPAGINVVFFEDRIRTFSDEGLWLNERTFAVNALTGNPAVFSIERTLMIEDNAIYAGGHSDGIGQEVDLITDIVSINGKTGWAVKIGLDMIDGPVGIRETNSFSGKTWVYPNPTQNQLNIILPPGGNRAEVYDQSGRLVMSQFIYPGWDRAAMDVSGLAGGMYMVRVVKESGEVMGVGRFVRE